MVPPLYECLSYETFIGLSAYGLMGIFFLSTAIVLDWSEIKHDIPGFDELFGVQGVISEEMALIFFSVLLVSAWVGMAIIADFVWG